MGKVMYTENNGIAFLVGMVALWETLLYIMPLKLM
jgi:hypothetical protein